MKKRLLAAMVIVLVVFAGSAMLAAQEKAPCHKEMKLCGEKASFHKEMTLTDEQQAKVEELKTSQRLKTIDLKADLQKLGIMFKQEMMKPDPSMQVLEGFVKKMTVAREKLQLSHIEHMLAMRKLLGPDWRGKMGMGCGESCGKTGGACMMMGGEAAECPHMMRDESMAGSRCCPMHKGPMPGAARGRGMMRGMKGCGGGDKKMVWIEKDGPAAGCGGGEKRMMRVDREGMGAGCGAGEQRMMCIEKSGSGKGCGAAARSCAGGKSCSGTCSAAGSTWNHKMFRPFGKKSGHVCSGECAGMGEMKGCGGQGERRIEIKKVIEKK